MRFTILHAEVMQTLGVVTARVRYVTNGSFISHRVRSSESTVKKGPPFLQSLTVCRCQNRTIEPNQFGGATLQLLAAQAVKHHSQPTTSLNHRAIPTVFIAV